MIYPHAPGTKKGSPDSAFAAARFCAGEAQNRRVATLTFIEACGRYGAIADEVSIGCGWKQLYSSRPRISELRAAKLIVPSSRYRRGISGRKQTVWISSAFATEQDPQGDLFCGWVARQTPSNGITAPDPHGYLMVVA